MTIYACLECGRLDRENKALQALIKTVQELVEEQAEDEGLWFVAETGAETYLQAALRKLHALIEETK